jgi:hypothetical protein
MSVFTEHLLHPDRHVFWSARAQENDSQSKRQGSRHMSARTHDPIVGVFTWQRNTPTGHVRLVPSSGIYCPACNRKVAITFPPPHGFRDPWQEDRRVIER